jgi:hypothetical protein
LNSRGSRQRRKIPAQSPVLCDDNDDDDDNNDDGEKGELHGVTLPFLSKEKASKKQDTFRR